MSLFVRQPRWVSHRRDLEQMLSNLQDLSDPRQLKQIHAQVLKFNLHQDLFVAPKLVAAYSSSDQLRLSVGVFNLIRQPNAFLYNAIIKAYTQQHAAAAAAAFTMFDRMRRNGVFPDNFTYPLLLKACHGRFSLLQVRMIHAHVAKTGFLADVFVPNALLDSYSKAAAAGGGVAHGIPYAEQLFLEMEERDVVTWNSIVAGLVRAGKIGEARKVFDEMPERDIVSWNTMLDGHAKAGEMDEAAELFDKMPQRNVVSWCAMFSGYSRSGDLDMARRLFDKMQPVKSLVPWTIMISGYALKGLPEDASRLLDQMNAMGLEPDCAAATSILAACAESGLLVLGKRIHTLVERTKLRSNIQVCNGLISMYAKCGNLVEALRVFEGTAKKDLVSWNSIIHGLAMHGKGEQALVLFHRMKHKGCVPDGVTLIGALSACTHAGLLEEGRRFFSSMERDYGIVPQIEHYGCMVDLLGRNGLLTEAFNLIKSMPFECNAVVWGALLGACRMHKNLDLAKEAAEQLMRLEPLDAGNYAMMSNIYASTGCWDGMAKSRLKMKETRDQKPAGSSWVELDGAVHKFTVGDRSHPRSDEIFAMLSTLRGHLKQVPLRLLWDSNEGILIPFSDFC